MAWMTVPDQAGHGSFPPEVACYAVKIACELPAERRLPLSQWDCSEIARELIETGIVQRISPDTVWRMLRQARLRPWRYAEWLSPRVPRDADFAARVSAISALYSGPLAADEVVLCIDEKTSLQPRQRCAPTSPPRPGVRMRLEHEYQRAGALNLFATFDTRTGRVLGMTSARKCAVDFLRFLDYLDASVPTDCRVHLVLDNLRVHKGRLAARWFAEHPRFSCHFPPVHCSWMNQVEQWFGILQRKLTRLANYRSIGALADALHAFIARWNERAHPFNWRPASLERVIAACSPSLPA
jgi:transposase